MTNNVNGNKKHVLDCVTLYYQHIKEDRTRLRLPTMGDRWSNRARTGRKYAVRKLRALAGRAHSAQSMVRKKS